MEPIQKKVSLLDVKKLRSTDVIRICGEFIVSEIPTY